MQLFVITSHCTSKLHCKTCRNKIGGRKWRESLTKNFSLPGGVVDFDCPHGVPWAEFPSPKTETPPQISAPETVTPVQQNAPTITNVSQPRERTGSRGGCGCGRG